jgi:hypothetical protein
LEWRYLASITKLAQFSASMFLMKATMSDLVDQNAVDTRNSMFWSELCGTQFAKSLGVTDSSVTSL